jgi:pyridoxine 4-dehydrogenase
MSAAGSAAGGSGPPASLAGRIELGDEVAVNRIGFGAMRLPGVWDAREPQQAHRLLRRAVELGVNFIDTAHAYGPEVSERLIAEALHPYPEDLIVATKGGFGPRGARGWAPDGRPGTIRRHCRRSLEVLRTERIDLLQLHTVDPAVPIEESVGAMVELQGEGKVGMLGISNVSVEELQRARAVGEIVSVQNRYHLADRASEDVLAVCERAGIAFLPWFPIGAGALARAGELQALATAHGATAAQVAVAWLLQRSPVLLPIPGTSSIAHLEDNVAAAGLRLSVEETRLLSR